MANRMTRQESRAMTRSRLVAAAAELFTEKGYYGAAVEEIASRAGYTRGAFYSNFTGKDEVFLAVFDERTAKDIADVASLVRAASSPEDLFAALRDRDARTPPDPAWLMLSTEFWLHALRDPAVRPKLAERERSVRRAYGQAIAAQFEALEIAPPVPVEHLAIVVEVLDDGIFRRRCIDPEAIPPNFLPDVLELLLDAAAALSRVRGTPP